MVDELHLHVAPLLLGSGVALFGGALLGRTALEIQDVVASEEVTHVSYRVGR